MNTQLEIVAADGNRCGESPIWDGERRRLLWTDVEGALVYEHVPATGETSILSRGTSVAGIGLDRAGGLLFAGSGGLVLWRGPGDIRPIVTEHDGEALNINDMIVDARGRVYAGTLYWNASGEMEKHGKLYRVDPGGQVEVVDEGIELANGLGFSGDGRTLYFTDSAARSIYAYDVDPASGALANRRLFVRIPGHEGVPDGLTVDAEEHVWSAQWYGAQVVRYDPEGRVERRIPMPVTQVSSVGFGGDDLIDLYITSAADPWPSRLAPPGWDPAASNTGGSLYRLRLGIRGRAEHRAAF
jgi:D-xylonolactonase